MFGSYWRAAEIRLFAGNKIVFAAVIGGVRPQLYNTIKHFEKNFCIENQDMSQLIKLKFAFLG